MSDAQDSRHARGDRPAGLELVRCAVGGCSALPGKFSGLCEKHQEIAKAASGSCAPDPRSGADRRAPSAEGFTPVRPAHYRVGETHEVFRCLEAWGSYDRGPYVWNAIKYLARLGAKPGAAMVDDLRKAKWYIDREIERLEGKQEEKK